MGKPTAVIFAVIVGSGLRAAQYYAEIPSVEFFG
jgi:hypothetical protein